jgi:hypothetical protein
VKTITTNNPSFKQKLNLIVSFFVNSVDSTNTVNVRLVLLPDSISDSDAATSTHSEMCGDVVGLIIGTGSCILSFSQIVEKIK